MQKTLFIVAAIFILAVVGLWYYYGKMIASQEQSFKEMQTAQIQESSRAFADSLLMSDTDFWKLIEDSKKAELKHFEPQMDYLTKQLSKLSNEQIVAFERTLRVKMVVLWDYNVKSVFQIIFGNYFAEEGFVDFRFWIISNGADFYDKILRNPEELADNMIKAHDGELLRHVADRAFELKNGRSHDLVFPREMAKEIDYDFGTYKMTGTYIALEDFGKQFPLLSDKF